VILSKSDYLRSKNDIQGGNRIITEDINVKYVKMEKRGYVRAAERAQRGGDGVGEVGEGLGELEVVREARADVPLDVDVVEFVIHHSHNILLYKKLKMKGKRDDSMVTGKEKGKGVRQKGFASGRRWQRRC